MPRCGFIWKPLGFFSLFPLARGNLYRGSLCVLICKTSFAAGGPHGYFLFPRALSSVCFGSRLRYRIALVGGFGD